MLQNDSLMKRNMSTLLPLFILKANTFCSFKKVLVVNALKIFLRDSQSGRLIFIIGREMSDFIWKWDGQKSFFPNKILAYRHLLINPSVIYSLSGNINVSPFVQTIIIFNI